MTQRLARQRRILEQLAKRRPMTDPTYYFQTKRQLLDRQSERLSRGLVGTLNADRQKLERQQSRLYRAMERTLSRQKERTGRLAASLDAMSPLKVLGRGYAIAQKEDGSLLSKVGDAHGGEKFDLRLSDGSVKCRVEQA